MSKTTQTEKTESFNKFQNHCENHIQVKEMDNKCVCTAGERIQICNVANCPKYKKDHEN